jgi:hypothetical protein
MRLVEDQINGETWSLHHAVDRIPCKGIDKLLDKLRRQPLFARGQLVLALVDADRTAEHVGLPKRAPFERVAAEILRRCSKTTDQVQIFFLEPSMEGLIGHIRTCNPSVDPVAVERALEKSLLARDIVLGKVATASHRALRDCLRTHQPGLDGLAKAIAFLLSPPPAPAP